MQNSQEESGSIETDDSSRISQKYDPCKNGSSYRLLTHNHCYTTVENLWCLPSGGLRYKEKYQDLSTGRPVFCCLVSKSCWQTLLPPHGKTRDLFKKIRDTKGTFHEKMGTIKDRNGMDITEVEDIKMWQEYTEELYKNIFMTQIIMMV